MPTLIFPDLDSWETWVDNNIVTNGMELITGDFGNITENAAIQFIKQSPLNWQSADIFSSGGVINVSRPINVFMSTTPTSVSWGNNIYNEFRFINTTAGDINSNTYYDINLQAVTIIPAKSIVNIIKAKNGNWIVTTVPSSGSSSALPLLKAVVDRGNSGDPVSGTSIWQNNNLIGLGSTTNGEIDFVYGTQIRSNYGSNKSFNYDNVLGEIDLNYNGSGEQWYPDSSVSVDRNQ